MKLCLIIFEFDFWEVYMDVDQYGDMQLINVEFIMMILCNMRCEYCVVGYILQFKDFNVLLIDFLLKWLEEILCLRFISIIGGELMFLLKLVKEYVVLLLKYVYEWGVWMQINFNLIFDID